jgi:Ca2+-binding RTX toxin-like protein
VITGVGGFDILSSGGGDDVIGYTTGRTLQMNGGTGTDTVRFDGNALGALVTRLTVDLGANTIDPVRSDGLVNILTAQDFENADFSAFAQTLNMGGTAADNVLIGGNGAGLIFGRGGADTLTGGGGEDSFLWTAKAEGGDTITDFTRGVDKLQFNDIVFVFSGSAFDTVTFDVGSGSLELEDTDMLVAGQTLNTADEVRAYVNNNSTSTQHGLFLVATSDSGSRVLYYTSNASASGANNAFFQIADLGEGPAPQMGDFVFI